MKKMFLPFVLAIAGILLTQPSLASLEDIETAVVQENFSKAIMLADEFIINNPDANTVHEAYYLLGISHLGQGEYDKARDVFLSLINQSVSEKVRDKSFLGLVDAHFLMENYNEALKTVQELQNINPKSEFLSLIYLKKARAHLKLAHWGEANKYLKKIVSDFPDSFEFHLAKQLLDEKRYFAVQVGSFIDRDRAEGLVNELKDKSEYAYIVETIDREGRIFYRVRVGQLSRLDDAQQLKVRLSKLGYPTQIYP